MNRLFVPLFALAVSAACAYHPAPDSAMDAIPFDGRAVKTAEDHFLQYAVATHIKARPADVWKVLTDGPSYAAWNSTVTALDGTIADGETFDLRVRVDQKRTFTLLVSQFDPPEKMVWEDGNKVFMGVRTFRLTELEDGTTNFDMREGFTGKMLGMIAKKLPNFAPEFEAFAEDLRAEVERAYPAPKDAETPDPSEPVRREPVEDPVRPDPAKDDTITR